jgi:DNA-3-methyladenine glycosylase
MPQSSGEARQPDEAGHSDEAGRPGDARQPSDTGRLVVQPSSAVTLPSAFFDRPVLEVARDLIGCMFVNDGVGGRIVETEAYAPGDPASHAFRGPTARNAVMFGPPGRVYVYFTYGMHFCANLVCEPEGSAAAVLLRALEPDLGVEAMAARRGIADERLLCSGPARLCQALGIAREHNGVAVGDSSLTVLGRAGEDRPDVVTTARIGVGAVDDGRPWRFVDARSAFLSRPLRRG